MTEQTTEQTRAEHSRRRTDIADPKSGVEVGPRRKRSAERTRQEILRAAARRFALAGYASATLKEIAADAGVTAALVVRYFGSKHDLFRAIMHESSTDRVDELLTGPLDTLGRRLADSMVASWLTPELIFPPIAALRSLDLEDAKSLFYTEVDSRFTDPLAAVLPGPHPHVRARVIVSQILAFGLFALEAIFEPEVGPASVENIDEIARLFGAAIQVCITPGRVPTS